MPFKEELIQQIDEYVSNHLPNDDWYENYFSFIEDKVLAERLEKEYKTIRYIYKILEGLKSTDELLLAQIRIQVVFYTSIYEAMVHYLLFDKLKDQNEVEDLFYITMPIQISIPEHKRVKILKALEHNGSQIFTYEMKKKKTEESKIRFDAKANVMHKLGLIDNILAFANAWRRAEAYILIGVKEIKGGKGEVVGIETTLDDASLQQFVNSKTQRPVHFKYKNYSLEGKTIGVITILENDRPIYLKKDYGRLKRNVVYLRRGSSTVEAEPDEIAKMGATRNPESRDPVLEFSFADIETKTVLPKVIDLEFLSLEFDGYIPDYQKSYSPGSIGAAAMLLTRHQNKEYYRELFAYCKQQLSFRAISFCIANTSTTTAADVRIELSVNAAEGTIKFLKKSDLNEVPEKERNTLLISPSLFKNHPQSPDIQFQRIKENWNLEVMFQKVQAGQCVFANRTVYISANQTTTIELDYRIYADNLSSPIEGKLDINSTCPETRTINLDDLLNIHNKVFNQNTPEDV